MSPVGALVVLVPLSLLVLTTRYECQHLEGRPADQQRVIPIMYRIMQVALAANVVWFVVAVVWSLAEGS
jgi:hypothetical protein